MSGAIAKPGVPDMSEIEQVLVSGDLSKLTSQQRVMYYMKTCESIGINPLTRPLEYIVLNNKLTLYARKDCTEQLRRNYDVSLKIVSQTKVDDMYMVTAHATMPTGRSDESIGAINIAGLNGENLANAIMKAETKAKRRVTLSICGLGLADESEIESSLNAQRVTVDERTGEIIGGDIPALPPVDFLAEIANAKTTEELSIVAKRIEESKNSGQVTQDARKALGKAYMARQAEIIESAK